MIAAMIEIEYILTPEDLAAANKQHLPSSSPYSRIFFIVFFVVLFTVMGNQVRESAIEWTATQWLALIPALALMGLVVYIGDRASRGQTRPDAVLKAHKGWEDIVFNVPTTMRIEPDHLFVATQFGESKTRWAQFRKANFSEAYTVLYTGPISVHIIPRRGVRRGDYDGFAAELKKHVKPTLD